MRALGIDISARHRGRQRARALQMEAAAGGSEPTARIDARAPRLALKSRKTVASEAPVRGSWQNQAPNQWTIHSLHRDMAAYPFKQIEAKWQSYWDGQATFRVPAKVDTTKPKYYVLDMFPYPSGDGLHVGHPEGYTATDIVARYKRMRGFNVLHPMGWDAFGLPAEQYAIKTGTHPRITTERNVKRFRGQMKSLGFSYDWQREVNTTDPGYYKWTQWIFKQLFERGLAYQEELPVKWCPELGTVLANEEVIDGKSEVGGYPVVRRPLRQWMLRITQYADALLEDLDDLDWPNSTKEMQRNWIGRSEGAEVDFAVDGHAGVTAARLHDAARHALRRDLYGAGAGARAGAKLATPELRGGSTPIATAASRKSDLERTELRRTRPASSPAPMPSTRPTAKDPDLDRRLRAGRLRHGRHHGRARATMSATSSSRRNSACPDPHRAAAGRLRRAERLGRRRHRHQQRLLERHERRASEGRDIDWLEREGKGERPSTTSCATGCSAGSATGASRSRSCSSTASRRPSATPSCPCCCPSWRTSSRAARRNRRSPRPAPGSRPIDAETGKHARRETNTMPQWAGSCWYYLRFIDPTNSERLIDPELEKYWLPVDLYVGGAEHAVLHLLYARFWHKVLFDAGVVSTPEPFQKLVNQGMILGEMEFTVNGERVAEEQVEKQGDRFVLRDRPELPVEARATRCPRAAATSSTPTRSSRATAPTRSGSTRCSWARSRR